MTMKKQIAVLLAAIICLTFPLTALCENTGKPADQPEVSSGTDWEDAFGWLKDLLFGRKQKTPETMTHQETVAALRDLGIEIPDETVRETEEAVAGMISDLKTHGINRGEQYWDFVMLLLARLGEGEYDFDTGAWTPTSSHVYAFDTEVWDIEHMYALFLQGVSSIVPGFACEDVTELITLWDEEEAKQYASSSADGTTSVAFTLNGNRYERQMDYLGDWFSMEAITWVNEVMVQEGFPGKLHMFFDGGQGLILFYGDDAYGEELRKVVPRLFENLFQY